MIVEIVSANEIAQRLQNEWTLTGKQTVIAGKLRTAEMQKEGNPMAWIEENNKIKQDAINKMNRTERRMYFQRSALYARGLEV